MFNISSGFTGQTDTPPNHTKIFTSDDLDTITTAGWLNTRNFLPNDINIYDVFDIRYGVSTGTNGSFAYFTVSIADGVITLVPLVSPGNVNLPVVDGNIAFFQGTTGAIGDDNVSVTDPTLTKVASIATGSYGAYTIGNIIIAKDTLGSLIGGIGNQVFQTLTSTSTTPSNDVPFYTSATYTNASGISSGSGTSALATMSVRGMSGGAFNAHSALVTMNGSISSTTVQLSAYLGKLATSSFNIGNSVVAPFVADMGTGITGTGLSNVCMYYGKNLTTIHIGALFNALGPAQNAFQLSDNGTSSYILTPAGSTPSGTLKTIQVEVNGVELLILCAQTYS